MATSASLVTRSQMELRFGPRVVALYIDDDGDEIGDSPVMELILQEGSQRAEGILLKGFSRDQVKKLVDNDAAVRGFVLDICADVMARRRPENISQDGNTPYTPIRKFAEQELKAIASAEVRARGETDAGKNAVVKTRTNLDPSPLIFARSSSCPKGQGGF